jgi:TRAP-type C4-dicarboxylate transport system substrate-binding protein
VTLPCRSPRRSPSRAAVALAVALGAGLVLPATGNAKEVLKLATLAPQGSVWDATLRALGARWSRESGGAVELRIYPGGVAGDEADVVRKMRIGQFQGAALSVTGLGEITPAFNVFHIPMLIESWAEVDAVLAQLRPELERRLAEKGYTLLFWSHGGWVHLFSREPIRTLADLKRQKLFVWAGSDAQVQQWRRHGYQPVPLAATDVTMGFQTKMIDVVPTTPIAALTLQWFRSTPYMQGLGLAPLIGAVVVQTPAWEKIDAAARAKLVAAAREAEAELAREVPAQDAAAVEQMKARGLQVIEISGEQRAEWRRAAEEFAADAHESTAPADLLAATRAAIARHRGAEKRP